MEVTAEAAMAAEAVAPGSDYLQANYLVVDIGSKTTDVVLLRKGLPVESRSITVEREMVKWMKQIWKKNNQFGISRIGEKYFCSIFGK